MTTQPNNARKRYRFGDYEIVRTIGTGGMGVVYEAEDQNLSRTVALKVLHERVRQQSHLVARFRREAEAFATLDHPNIVHIYSVGTVGRIPYIAMEYIEGRALSKVLLDRAPLPWQEALAIGADVARALACAHQAQIIHRDVKPANILLGEDGTAYVTDFGIAKVLNATQQLTTDGSRLGTPQYMCPERCKDQEITPASDIYSLGVMLFQSIAGRLPYEADDTSELIQKIATAPPARLHDFVPDVPEPVERLVAYMLEKRPEDRPAGARVLADTIDRVLRGEPLDAHADEMSDALASYRESFVSETPRESTPPPPPARKMRPALRPRLWRALERVPPAAQTALLTAVLAGVAAAALLAMRAWLKPPSFAGIESGPDYGVERWAAPLPEPVAFHQETETVRLFQLPIAEAHVSRLAWSRESGAIIALTGNAESPWANVNALFLAKPRAEEGYVLSAPRHEQHGGNYTLLGASVGQCFLHAKNTVYAVACEPGTAAAPLAHTPRAAFAAHPLEPRCTLVRNTPESVFEIAEVNMNTLSTQRVWHESAYPAAALAYNADGERLAALVPGKPQDTLWVMEAHGEAEPLARGPFALPAHPFSPGGHALLVVRTEAESQHLEMLDITPGGEKTGLGPGLHAAWHPGGQYVVATAADRIGRTQLWAVELAPPHRRMQLTHLRSGVEGAPVIAAEENLALVAQHGAPAVAAVTLPAHPAWE